MTVSSFFNGFDVIRIDADGMRIPLGGESLDVASLPGFSALGTIVSDANGYVAGQEIIGAVEGSGIQFSSASYSGILNRITAASAAAAAAIEANFPMAFVIENLQTAVAKSDIAEVWLWYPDHPEIAHRLLGVGAAGTVFTTPLESFFSWNYRIYLKSKPLDGSGISDPDFTNAVYQDISADAIRPADFTSVIIDTTPVAGGTAGRLLTSGTHVGETPTIGALQSVRRNVGNTAFEAYRTLRPLFDHYADAINTRASRETLYTDQISGGTLAVNGDKITAEYSGTFVTSGETAIFYAKFAGTDIFDSSTETISTITQHWKMCVTIIRVSNTVVGCAVEFSIHDFPPFVTYTEISSLDLSGNYNLLLDVDASGSNVVAAKMGYGEFTPTADPTDPVLLTTTVENAAKDHIVLTYSKALNAGSIPATGDFSVSGGKSVTGVAVAGAVVTLTVNSAYAYGDTITVSYTPGTNKTKDVPGNLAASLSTHAVTNNIVFSAIALVAHAGANSNADQANSTTSAIDTTGATLLVVGVAYALLGSPPTLSDSKTNSWTAGTLYQAGAGNGYFRFYYCTAPSVGSGHTFHATGASTYNAIAAAAFSSTLNAAADGTNGAGTASATTQQPGTLTPSQNNEVVITGLALISTGSTAASIGSGFTITDTINGNPGFAVALAYKVQTTAGAENPTWSSNVAAERIVAAITAFKHS